MSRVITIILCLVAISAFAQRGDNRAFGFLQSTIPGRVAALGGVNVSLADRDLNFFHGNPALAGDTLNGVASAGYQFYLADVGTALFSYAHDFENVGQIIAGMQHRNYGTIQGFDENGVATTEYSAGETSIVIGRSHHIGNFRIGASVKGIFSNVAGYRASAIAVDVGGLFKHPQHDLTLGIVVKNIGVVLSDYSETSTSGIPFDLQAGVSIKPDHMPLRFSFTGHHLGKKNLLYVDPATEKVSTLKKVLSHLNFGAEILFHRNVNGLVGYNYLLHQALISETGGIGGGICFGFSLLVRPVEFIFSRSAYTVGNAGYSFTLATNMDQLLRKKKY